MYTIVLYCEISYYTCYSMPFTLNELMLATLLWKLHNSQTVLSHWWLGVRGKGYGYSGEPIQSSSCIYYVIKRSRAKAIKITIYFGSQKGHFWKSGYSFSILLCMVCTVHILYIRIIYIPLSWRWWWWRRRRRKAMGRRKKLISYSVKLIFNIILYFIRQKCHHVTLRPSYKFEW